MLAAMFLFVFFVEMGSHVMIDSQDPNAVTEAVSCSLDETFRLVQTAPTSVDSGRRQRTCLTR